MPMARPAAAMEPCSAINSRRRALPGPSAPRSPNSTRRLRVAIAGWRSAPGHAHMARHGGGSMAAIDDEVMAFGFAADGLMDRRLQHVVSLAGAHGLAQVGVVILAEAHIEHAGASQPHAVAAFAEIVGHWRDESDASASLTHAHIARRTAGAVVDLIQRPFLREIGTHDRERQILLEPRAFAHFAHGHHLDEGEVMALVAAPFDHGIEFAVVDILERNGVDLDPQ